MVQPSSSALRSACASERMNSSDMREIAETLAAGDHVEVRATSSRTAAAYTVKAASGKASREVTLVGRRGAERVLVDDGERLWLRAGARMAKHGSTHRLVLELRRVVRVDLGLRRALAAAQRVSELLPDGYSIETTWLDGKYMHRASCGEWKSSTYTPDSSYAAICALRHAIGCAHLRTNSSRHESTRQIMQLSSELTEAQRRAKAQSHTLQQIREMVTGQRASGSPLPAHVPPEQVAADVGHRLVLLG